eukprot:comp12390_c0_seq1/m.16203 comp12390_c0_seq1/g.16203  ORF comp12390_c0_seq1/g.16203 comp12390_c0_seq1/m.16203 type:complete len:157 (-) comp12390_c0_seq1:20-490(-)
MVKPIGPYTLISPVIHGFKRGSKELGIPTANLDLSSLESAQPEIFSALDVGIYFGWAQVKNMFDNNVFPMVMSIGWNPFYNNTVKTVEVHLMAEEQLPDFYDSTVICVVLGYIRSEKNFSSREALIEEIHNDMKIAKNELKKGENNDFKASMCFFE